MRIVIDMQGAQSKDSRSRGIGRYTISFTKFIIANKANHEIILLLNGSFTDTIASLKQEFSDILPLENIKVWYPLTSLDNKQENEKISQITQSHFIQNLKPDFLIVSSLFEGCTDNCIYSIDNLSNIKTAVILYDLIPYIYKDIYLKEDFVLNWYLSRVKTMQKADVLLSISESSRQEAINHISFPANQIFNISTAADSQFKPVQVSQSQYQHIKSTYNLNKQFIMYTGGIDHRKNIDNLILAYAKLDKSIINRYQLAIVCSIRDNDKSRLYELAKNNGLAEEDIVFTGFVPEQDLILLYNLCHLFVFPSWHEGFGLPALEAMQCNAPVIVSNISSLPEVVENDDALFDPHSLDSICEKITQALTDENFRQSLIEKAKIQVNKFSWNETALRAIQALEYTCKNEIITQTGQVEIKSNKKLAYISPIPNAKSGIADYSADLLPELSKYYDITIIVNQDEVSKSILDKFHTRNTDWFKKNHKSFDRVVYHFGNSEFHEHMFSLLKNISGVVVQHDFFVSNIHAHMQNKNNKYTFDAELYKSHGYTALRDRYISLDKAITNYPTNFSIIEKAVGIITHSNYAKYISKGYYPNLQDTYNQNWHIIPLLKNSDIQINKKQSRQKLGLDDNEFITCSFGILAQTKKNIDIVQAWLDSDISKADNSKLIFVGDIDEKVTYCKELLDLINSSNKKSQIVITGWVDKNAFHDYLCACDIAVQLRGISRGETSAAVLDTMNYGIPTIINANGSMAELPKSCVYMLEDNFKSQDLILALNAVYQDKHLRNSLSKNAREFILQNHNPKECARQYFNSIESFYVNNKNTDLLITKIAEIYAKSDANNVNLDDNKFRLIAKNIALNNPNLKPNNQLFIDVSILTNSNNSDTTNKLSVSQQHLLRQKLSSMLNNNPNGYRVEPIYFDMNNNVYRYARSFSLDFLNINRDLCSLLHDDVIEYSQGDVLLLDNDRLDKLKQEYQEIYTQLYVQGVEFVDVVDYI